MAQVLSAEGEAHEHELRELRGELAAARAEAGRLREELQEQERVSRAERATAGLSGAGTVQGAADAAAALAAAIRRSDAAEARAASSAISEREALVRAPPRTSLPLCLPTSILYVSIRGA